MFTDSPSSQESACCNTSVYSDDSVARETPTTGSFSYNSFSSSCSQNISMNIGARDSGFNHSIFPSVIPHQSCGLTPPGLSLVSTSTCPKSSFQPTAQIHYQSQPVLNYPAIKESTPPLVPLSINPPLEPIPQYSVSSFIPVDQYTQQSLVPSPYYCPLGPPCHTVPVPYPTAPYSPSQSSDSQSQKSGIPSPNFLATNIVSMYTTKQGSKNLQSLLSTHGKTAVQAILPHLHPHIVPCMFHIYGNHVLQAMINQSRQQVGPILYHLLGDPQILVQACINTYASWVVRVLFKEGQIDPAVLSQVIDNFATICNNTCGNYVIQHLLENKKCPKSVIQQLINDAPELVFGKYSSHLLEKLIKENILPKNFLLPFISKVALTRYLPTVLESKYGSYVIEKAILKVVQVHGMIDTVTTILRICKYYIQKSSKHYKNIIDCSNATVCETPGCEGNCALCTFFQTSRLAFDIDKIKTMLESIESVNRSFLENVPQYEELQPLALPFFC